MTPAASGGAESVGSVAEEAAKLIAMLSEHAGRHDRDQDGQPGAGSTGEGCRWCPHCQAIGFVRGTNPELREQLVGSAGAFVLALRELLDQAGRAPAERANPVDDTEPGATD